MLKKLLPLWRGLAVVFLSLLVAGVMLLDIATQWRSTVDGFFGTQSYVIDTESGSRFQSHYDSATEMMEAAKNFAIKQGREGFVVMKNDNNALPLDKSKSIALFGAAAWKPYMQSAGDLKAGNADRKNLDEALVDAGFTLDQQMKDIYDNILADYTESSRFGNTTITYTNGYVTSPGDLANYQVREVPPDRYTDTSLRSADAGPWIDIPSDWREQMAQTKEDRIGIVVFARGAGESNTYKPGAGTTNFAGETTDKDPLALSDDELAVIDAAKDTCDTVIVLLNTGNAMEIGDIAEGGAHEVDAIGYMGVINDYQCIGIVQVLSGEYNATGALPDTYAYKNMSAPAMMNFGGDEYVNISEVDAEVGEDPRWPNEAIYSGASGTSGFGGSSYSGSNYIVEAEGIYVGYQYYETRYYDSIANPSFNASSTAGSTDGAAWDYNKEVVYTFGHGVSYLDYTQEVTNVTVDLSENGNVTATVAITNNSDEDGYFLAQLYVQQPYTEYDRDNLVEKSAVMFLNSAKKEVAAGATEEVTITVPSKYLASYDYINAKTYILDEGDYLFTAANGAHEAVNNFLAAQGFDTADGMDANGTGDVFTWTLNSFDDTTFATANGHEVTNVADNADMNYWLPGTVTYLSRADWEGTYPVNYNYEADGETINQDIDLNKSSKKDEWIKEIRGMQYTIDNTGAEVSNVDGADLGYKFNSSAIPAGAYEDINHEYWDNLVAQISVNEALGAVIHGGGQSDTLTYVDNPVVGQNEGVNGIKGTPSADNPNVEEDEVNYHYNVNSQTLMGSSFNPDLALAWGRILGNSGLWTGKYQIWGGGLNYHRSPYNGRNTEYLSEDPMLTNVLGTALIQGSNEFGIINGPKHIGFNDQEYDRSGICVYMDEQKLRQTDLRGFQGAVEEGEALGLMVAFNRIGAINASHHVGMLKNILREEWGFTGVISTDLANNAKYFNAEAMIMATVTQRAEFGGNNSYLSESNNHSEGDKTYTYISVDSTKNDAVLVNQAREDLKYQLYTFANSQVVNVRTREVTPPWESALNGIIIATGILSGAAVILWLASSFINDKKEVK